MFTLSQGIVAGVLAGIVMGIACEAAYGLRVFRSSLFQIDGRFVLKSPSGHGPMAKVYGVGIVVHLVTSGVFGGAYVFLVDFLGIEGLSVRVMAAYFILLWLSMLFVALPVAGHGLLGRKTNPAAWWEQLVLHVVFGSCYYAALNVVTL
jgi:hypothetical protein